MATPSGLPGAVKVVVKSFLEQKHYRQLHRVLSEEWSSCHSLTAAVKLMESHGVAISPEEEKRFAALPEERMIDALVARMPSQSREQFEHFFLQLSLIASTTTRLRSSLEVGDQVAIGEVLESAENVGILGYILKMAVAQAGNEVRAKEQAHDEWLADTDSRMAPLLQSQAQAMVSQKALEQAKAQLGAYRVEANEKSKKVLLGMVSGNASALMSTIFVSWSDMVARLKREAAVRVEYEDEINAAQQALADFKQKQVQSIKGVLMKGTEAAKGRAVLACYNALKKELEDYRFAQQGKEEAAELEAKLAGFAASSRDNAKSVLARMNAGNEDALRSLIFKTWIAFIEDYKKNKVLEDQVKAAEARVKEFQAKQKEGSMSVLNKMSAATDSGLIQSVFHEWKEIYEDEKRQAEMEEAMGEKAGKLGNFASRNKGTAMHEMNRMIAVAEAGLQLAVFHFWKRDTKVERMRRYGREKNKKRKDQLVGVKGLFKNFASELENGLKEGTPRIDERKLKARHSQPTPK